jgi:hypothetical protein
MDRFADACARFEAAHREDPEPHAGGTWSTHYHARVAHYVDHLDPSASEALRLAARCAHIRRWSIPRESRAPGRSGYKQWRSELARFHGEQAAEILAAAGYDEDTIERVRGILAKRRLSSDPEVQTFEDALCLVFLEDELEELAARHDEAKLAGILSKTWNKMSARGREEAMVLVARLPAPLQALVRSAVSADP